MKKISRETTHKVAWLTSLVSLPVAVIGVVKGATPVQVATWLMVVVGVQLIHLIPGALELKEVYNDEDF